MNQFEMNMIPTVPMDVGEKTPEQFDQKYWGEQFKKILSQQKDNYAHIFESFKMVAGEQIAEANRNSSILKGGLKDFINLPNFPQDKKQLIWQSLALLEMHDPASDLLQYKYENDPMKKNMLAQSYNDKISLYLSSVKPLIESLKGILPDEMVHELWGRNSMFLTPLTLKK